MNSIEKLEHCILDIFNKVPENNFIVGINDLHDYINYITNLKFNYTKSDIRETIIDLSDKGCINHLIEISYNRFDVYKKSFV